MIVVPQICEAGAQAALRGTKMATIATPLGFFFCPHVRNTPEWHNFISGAIDTYFGNDDVKGQVSGWVAP